MSQPLAAVALTPGTATPIPCGNAPAVGAVVLYNESPYAIQVRAGSKGGWLPAWTGDRYDTGGDAAWDGTIVVTPQAIASNTGQAPSFSILPVIYGSGEPVPGTYPASLTRQVVQGQVVTSVTQVIQDNQTNGLIIVEATPTGQPQNVLITTDGNATLRGAVNVVGSFTVNGNVIATNANAYWFGAASHYSQLNSDQGGSVELGSHNGVSPGGTQAPYIDFHSSNNARDYDARIQGTGGGASDGLGQITIFGSAGLWLNNGPMAQVGGQATVGSFGVPVIVAQTPAAGVSVTTTGVQTLFSFTPAANGLYELRGTFTQANGSASTYDFWMSYTDPVTGGNPKASLLTSQGGQALIGLAIGASTGTSIPCAPATGFNSGGHAILVQFNDHAGTPNDTVYAQLWRLS